MTAPVVAARAARAVTAGKSGGSTPPGPQSRGGRLALGIALLWLGAVCLYLSVEWSTFGDTKWGRDDSGGPTSGFKELANTVRHWLVAEGFPQGAGDNA